MSVEVTKLPSGLTVITDTMPHLETAALGVWAGVGGRDEKPNEHGISHLLEHMAFKGTARRSSREIVEEIEAVGGDLNAGTSTETTAYYARVMKADVPLALDVLSDILANPSFVPDELERVFPGCLAEAAPLRHIVLLEPRPGAAGSETSPISVCIISLTSVASFASVPVTSPRKQPTSAMRSRWLCHAMSG